MVLLPPFHLSGKEVDTLMRRDRFNAPLTEEEQKFAEENHYLIAKYLRKRRLPIDEWYDVVLRSATSMRNADGEFKPSA